MIPSPFLSRGRLFSPGSKHLILFPIAIFFWSFYDSIIAYLTPNIIESHGFTHTFIGIIIATSSIAGAIFDILLGLFLHRPHYRRIWFVVIMLCSIHPFVLGLSTGVFGFIIAMCLWGLYYDLSNFAIFDFLGRHSPPKEHSRYSGIVTVFKSLGYFVGPLLAGLLINEGQFFHGFSYALLFLTISFLILIILDHQDGRPPPAPPPQRRRLSLIFEFRLWRQIGRGLFPVIVFGILLNSIDANYWTIGPLLSARFPQFADFGGIFLALYELPLVFTGWLVAPLTQRFGKKRTAYYSSILSSVFLLPFIFLRLPLILLILNFIASLLSSFAWPAIRAAWADYVSESLAQENEITAIQDLTANLGYIIGPISAGIIADLFGPVAGFGLIGLISLLVCLVLLRFTPRHIRLHLSVK